MPTLGSSLGTCPTCALYEVGSLSYPDPPDVPSALSCFSLFSQFPLPGMFLLVPSPMSRSWLSWEIYFTRTVSSFIPNIYQFLNSFSWYLSFCINSLYVLDTCPRSMMFLFPCCMAWNLILAEIQDIFWMNEWMNPHFQVSGLLTLNFFFFFQQRLPSLPAKISSPCQKRKLTKVYFQMRMTLR